MRGIDTAVPSVLIENAPGRATRRSKGPGVAVRRALGLDARTPLVLYTGTFEAYQGLDLLFASMKQRRWPRGPTRGWCSRAAGRIRSTRRARQAAAAGIGDVDDLRRPAAGRGDPRVSRRGRRARLAAQPRHEHAAEDLPVPRARAGRSSRRGC